MQIFLARNIISLILIYLIVSTRQWSSGRGTGKIMKTYGTMIIIFGSQAKNLNKIDFENLKQIILNE
jgi:dihydroxyacetone kinase